MRPSTLSEVSERVADGADPTKEFSEFLDHFYDCGTRRRMSECLAEAPLLLRHARLNAMYAATAEYLSKRYLLSPLPEWVYDAERYLDQPWFVTSDESLREFLVYSSPAEFRSRNIFTEAVPLRRARTWQAEQRFRDRSISLSQEETPTHSLRA